MERFEVTVPGVIVTWVNLYAGPDMEKRVKEIEASLDAASQECPDWEELSNLVDSKDAKNQERIKGVYACNTNCVSACWLYAANIFEQDPSKALAVLERAKTLSDNPHLTNRTLKFIGDYQLSQARGSPLDQKVAAHDRSEATYSLVKTLHLVPDDTRGVIINRGANLGERGDARIKLAPIYAAYGLDIKALFRDACKDFYESSSYAACGEQFCRAVGDHEYEKLFKENFETCMRRVKITEKALKKF